MEAISTCNTQQSRGKRKPRDVEWEGQMERARKYAGSLRMQKKGQRREQMLSHWTVDSGLPIRGMAAKAEKRVQLRTMSWHVWYQARKNTPQNGGNDELSLSHIWHHCPLGILCYDINGPYGKYLIVSLLMSSLLCITKAARAKVGLHNLLLNWGAHFVDIDSLREKRGRERTVNDRDRDRDREMKARKARRTWTPASRMC